MKDQMLTMRTNGSCGRSLDFSANALRQTLTTLLKRHRTAHMTSDERKSLGTAAVKHHSAHWGYGPLAALAVCFQLAFPLNSYSASPFASIQEGLKAANNASDQKERSEIFNEISEMPIQTTSDVQALYDEMQNTEREAKKHPALAKDSIAARDILDRTHALSSALSKAVQPENHEQVAKFLEQESSGLPRFYAGVREETSQEEYLKAIPREERLQALMEAAGKGKNRAALSVLRKMAKRQDFAGNLAVKTISQIGDPQDLENFISQIKRNPKARFDLSGYGPMLTNRILTELNDSSSSSELRQKFAGYLVQAGDHAGIPRFLPFLKDKDRVVAHIAARAIAQNVTSNDPQVLQTLLKDPDEEIRGDVLDVLNNHEWNPAWSAILINILEKDKGDSCRMMAAHLLGKYKVQEGRSALEKARNDQSMLVRGAAESALQKLSK